MKGSKLEAVADKLLLALPSVGASVLRSDFVVGLTQDELNNLAGAVRYLRGQGKVKNDMRYDAETGQTTHYFLRTG